MTPPVVTKGRFILTENGVSTYAYRALCPGCGVEAILDDDQFHGRVSIQCECGYHETHDLSKGEHLMVKAKFVVVSVTKRRFGSSGPIANEVELVPVTANQGEDSIFGQATPNGKISMTILNPAAAAVFENSLGQKFYVDFTPAES